MPPSDWPDEKAIDAALSRANEDCELPYMARITDFSDAEVAAGLLGRADEAADKQNYEWMRAVLTAAAKASPVIPVTALRKFEARQRRATDDLAGHGSLGRYEILNDLEALMDEKGSNG